MRNNVEAIYKIACFLQETWPDGCEFYYGDYLHGSIPYFLLSGMEEKAAMQVVKPQVEDILKDTDADIDVTVECGKHGTGMLNTFVYLDDPLLTWEIIFKDSQVVPPHAPINWLIGHLQAQLFYSVIQP